LRRRGHGSPPPTRTRRREPVLGNERARCGRGCGELAYLPQLRYSCQPPDSRRARLFGGRFRWMRASYTEVQAEHSVTVLLADRAGAIGPCGASAICRGRLRTCAGRVRRELNGRVVAASREIRSARMKSEGAWSYEPAGRRSSTRTLGHSRAVLSHGRALHPAEGVRPQEMGEPERA
jgi:hypothetical protein